MTDPRLKEFERVYAGRFFGKRRAVVKDIADPKRLQRVRVICPSIYGEDLSPWCAACTPMAGSIDSGASWIPQKDSHVWIEFEEGNPAYPIQVGGCIEDVSDVGRPTIGAPIEGAANYQGNTKPTPMHVQGELDGTDMEGTRRGQDGVPGSGFAGEYGKVRGLYTPGGHRIELDDTEGAQRIFIQHRSGSIFEMRDDGSIHVISNGGLTTSTFSEKTTVEKDSRQIVKGNKVDAVYGTYMTAVTGDRTVTYGSIVRESMGRELRQVEGSQDVEVGGNRTIEVLSNLSTTVGGAYALGCSGDGTFDFGGRCTIIGQNTMNEDLDVGQESLRLEAWNGEAILEALGFTASSLLTGSPSSRYGVRVRSLGNVTTGKTLPTEEGPFVALGNLAESLSSFEPGVLGNKLEAFLQDLLGYLDSWLADYAVHAHPWYSPAYTSASIKVALDAKMAKIRLDHFTPTEGKLRMPMLSDTVILSKE